MILRDARAQAHQRLERPDGRNGHSCGQRDLRLRVQDVLGVWRERARFLERVQRTGGVSLAGLHAREHEQRLHGLEAF